ncbi:photosystem II biosynthesis protein [Cyclobacterium roseum]|uniref:photosystem II biosynthesis protein n=1 Tax=Cyclobacterium roseum TaxID=2666137 RepID=UPI001391DFC7|nr:photosystem II biosynthesis protein [Cyclobacterium roseum]
MKNATKNTVISLLLAGMALGTAWAIRGQFGHEQGAAWAGGIGSLCIILLSKKKSWYNKAMKAAFAGAVGWGLGGMMSYGAVVGYGRGVDFVNVYYGLAMLFIIGGLYGLIGGGLFGLVLADHPEKKVKWHQVITEMTVGGVIFYYFIIEQLGIAMTPPRSEAWGVCAGIGIAMMYYLARKKQYSAMRVAVFAGLGGGFGFAFGNFLQVLGNVAEVSFNMWNVMEYSLGFFGGLGMAYGAFTSSWPKEEENYRYSYRNLTLPMIGFILLIPFIVWQQSFVMKDLETTLGRLIDDPALWVRMVQWVALMAFLIPAITWISLFSNKKGTVGQGMSYKEVMGVFITYFAVYIVFTILITGSFLSFYRIEQFLYIINFIVIIFLIHKFQPQIRVKKAHPKKWGYMVLGILLLLAVLSLIAISIHGEMPGMNKRFDW